MRILGIETSCDETALSLLDVTEENGETKVTVLGDELFSQVEIHKEFGGVFPMMAKREHAKNLVPLLEKLLRKIGLLTTGETKLAEKRARLHAILEREADLEKDFIEFIQKHEKPANLDAIAVTVGPGLEPALWVGLNFAFALKEVWNVPVIPTNHMEGHVVSALLPSTKQIQGPQILQPVEFPLLSLLISGGHTEIVLSKNWSHHKIVGQTRDDAVGEAFDKVARILGLPYPGGPEISRLANEWRTRGEKAEFNFPRPMIASNNLDFSFSGLKTAVLYFVKKAPELTHELKQKIAAEFEEAIVDVLITKVRRAIEEYNPQTVTVGGGVIANLYIRQKLVELARECGVPLHLPSHTLSTDNAIMIALAGYLHNKNSPAKKEWEDVRADGNLRISTGSPNVC